MRPPTTITRNRQTHETKQNKTKQKTNEINESNESKRNETICYDTKGKTSIKQLQINLIANILFAIF